MVDEYNVHLLVANGDIFAVSSSADVHGHENAEADYNKYRRS